MPPGGQSPPPARPLCLQVSQDELLALLGDTGWRLSYTLGDGPSYVAIIEKAE